MDFGIQANRQYPGMSTTQGIYRAAFPLYKIYVFGKEISGDTISVRVNQSGGSQDRATSSCAITLSNLQDKYILTHGDIITLTDLRNIVSENSSVGNSYKGELSNIVAGILSNPDETTETSVFPYAEESANFVVKELSELNRSWNAHQVSYTLKGSVLSGKIYKEGAIDLDGFQHYYYPLAEGDCIFHPNDPVRVAFRDPFEPRVWYWQFSGYVDGFTEEQGVHNDSTVTLACSDVLKAVRYALVQSNLDVVRDKSLKTKEVRGVVNAQNLQELNWVATQDLFAKLTLPEILDAIFFGAKSETTEIINAVARWQKLLGGLKNDTKVLQRLAYKYKTPVVDDAKAQLSPDGLIKGIVGEITSRWQSLSQLGPLRTPAGTQFKKNPNQHWGIYPYYIQGTTESVKEDSFYDVVDKAFSQQTTLKDLNDRLHHRVRVSDLEVMRRVDFAEGVNVIRSASVSSNDPVQIIDLIGSDPESYPVGGGRVFFIAPAGFQGGLITGLTNEDANGASSDMHSEYKDLLTYLFDLSDSISFCCYATPRGDVVFELPLYDYNPWDFEDGSTSFRGNEDRYSDDALEARAALSARIDKWSTGESKYTAEEVYGMLQASSNLQLQDSGYALNSTTALVNSLNQEFDKGVDYASYFTVEQYDSMGFSNSLSDTGLKTFSRVAPHTIPGFEGGQNVNLSDYQYSFAYASIDMLGFRMTADVTPWTRVATPNAARLYSEWELRKANAEARNIGLPVVSKFGLMVNRPLYWRKRNYVANIVNLQHSISANSSCGTNINLNYGRAWSGQRDSKGGELRDHLGGRMPLNYALLVTGEASSDTLTQGKQEAAVEGTGKKTGKKLKRKKKGSATGK